MRPPPPPAGEVGDVRRSSRAVRWTAAAIFVVLIPLFIVFARFGTNATLVRSPLLGKPAPPFDLERIDGPGRVSTASLAGSVVVVNFWASWCVPCRTENGDLDRFDQAHAGQGVQLVGILYNDSVSSALQFRHQLGGSWPLVSDPGDRVALDYGVRGVPETFVIDRRGIIVAKFVGAVSQATLESVIAGGDVSRPPVQSRNDQYRTAP